MRNGKLITIEGISNSGRTLQLHHLAQYLIDCGQTVLDLREPLCIKSARHRKTLAEQKATVIETALNGGCIVLAEGFFDCEIAWHGDLPDVEFKSLARQKKSLQLRIKPDLSFVLESDLGASWAGTPDNLSDSNKQEITTWINSEIFYEKAEAQWTEIVAQAEWPVYRISADQNLAVIQQRMIYHTTQLLHRTRPLMPFLPTPGSAKKTAAHRRIKLTQQAPA